ncbi:MAG TPA: DUF2742 domain-containing protein [Nocardioides sp.]|uniref:DUF2742 domain-containing protein n=1 Tax=uncultured Nocardioides sp. TaxID=198441 RepID=UPI00262A8D5A|nr:DUF2742 domain-containing protein [uncultured Nocardioides sp.]HRD60453.1 DUF2742 domain-containing protein [Nocardioides sp.]HRI94074.1 DUF2742 domain-containing protein [Nocardioides sp.]HRK44119.1 DUF2742 domain-containing protein [Nocardioides sp.]
MTRTERRKAQARPFIRRAPDAPLYGSEEFLALPDGDPAKVSAVYRAAEAYLTEFEERLEQLRAQHEFAAREAAKRAEDAEFVRNRDEHRRAWTGRGFRRDRAIEADVEREWREWVAS